MIEKLSPEARTMLSDFLNQIDYEKDKEIERLKNIIFQIYAIFENGRFEDNCDCIQIEELITREVKGSDKE